MPIDLEAMTSTLPWPAGGTVARTSPFFGQMGVAPAAAHGVVGSSRRPARTAGTWTTSSSAWPRRCFSGERGGRAAPGTDTPRRATRRVLRHRAGDEPGGSVPARRRFCRRRRGALRVLRIATTPRARPSLSRLIVNDAVFAIAPPPARRLRRTSCPWPSTRAWTWPSERALLDAVAWAMALTGAGAESVYRTASLAFDAGIPQVVNGLKTARVARAEGGARARCAPRDEPRTVRTDRRERSERDTRVMRALAARRRAGRRTRSRRW